MRRAALAVAVAVAALLSTPGLLSAAPTGAATQCGTADQRPAVTSLDPKRDAIRVFAMQYEQQIANVVSYGSFAHAIDCLIEKYVLPFKAHGRPNIVVFNEDVGLETIATGSRGVLARDLFAQTNSISCEKQGIPCATLAALGTIGVTYAKQLLAYKLRFPSMGELNGIFVAATDTMVRGFMTTFAEAAKRYGIYIVGSNDQAPFAVSTRPADIDTFADPDQPRPSSVYVARSPDVYNDTFMWGPRDLRTTGPQPERNLVASNLKVPLTSLELELGMTAGPSSGAAAVANLEPFHVPGTRARLGFATSLPAFTYGSPPAGVNPCTDTQLYYMRCLNQLGANVLIQAEANPGRWTGTDGSSAEQWQPLSWMLSSYRAVSDPSVSFDYAVNPMMTGNLADLDFDGQSAIMQRGLRGAGCHYIGDAAFVPGEDLPSLRSYAGNQPDFLAIAPWVTPDAPRAALRATGAGLAPGSGSPLEDHYVETALIADLPIPLDRRRHDCAT